MAYIDFEKVSKEIESYFGIEDEYKKIKGAAVHHYTANEMDKVLEPFVGRPEEFISFIVDTWGWKVTFDRDNGVIIADENKPFCVCPLDDRVKCPKLCNCSEGFLEMMFSKVFGRPVQAAVKASVLCGDKSCVYEVKI
jgi:predicted hydrocarbon binding protein